MLLRPATRPVVRPICRGLLDVNNNGWPLRNQLFDGAPIALPLTHTVIGRGGLTPSFTRATTETGQKWDEAGYLDFTALAGEIVFKGARRVRNWIQAPTENWSSAGWAKSGISVSGNRLTATGANGVIYDNAALGMGTDRTAVGSVTLSRVAGTGSIDVSTNGGTTWTTVSVTGARVSVSLTGNVNGQFAIRIVTSGDAVDATYPQLEDVTGQTTQTASEYVSVGVESAPAYHGSMVDGVKCFDTDRSGNPISTSGSYPLIGYVPWEARTNLLLQSAVVATQSIAVAAVSHTLSFKGTGTITLSGASVAGPLVGTGANDRVTLTFTPTAGSLTLTVSGSCTVGQLEAGSFATPYIPTTTVAVARNASVEGVTTSGAILAAGGTISLTYIPYHAPSGTIALWGTYVDASNYTAILHDATNLIFRKRIAGVNYDATIANAFTSGTTYKMAASWGAGGSTIYLNGVAGTPHANTTAAQIAATMQFGADGNSLQQPGAAVIKNYIWQRQLSGSEQAAVTA